jgi:hypothetical protein
MAERRFMQQEAQEQTKNRKVKKSGVLIHLL